MIFALAFGLLAGCATTPSEEQVAAQQAIEEAKAAVAEAEAGGWPNEQAKSLLQQAEEAFANEDYTAASDLANKSKQHVAASKAIFDAKAAAAAAEAAGSPWRDTENLIGQAEQALSEGDTAKAIQLANEARRQAENALRQAEAEKARLASEAAAATKTGAGDYTVVRGDSLWHISGKSEVYGNPYQWPLIYKANRSKIKDADLIYPGQQLTIDRNASDADIKAAVNHAKTRGAWSLGVVEESDRAYLSR
ncbi:MAG TPA: LysM peptidoglycan-binding domain-containing protein [Gammaproteobacteria bacterium]